MLPLPRPLFVVLIFGAAVLAFAARPGAQQQVPPVTQQPAAPGMQPPKDLPQPAPPAVRPPNPDAWEIPTDAPDEKNPIEPTEQVLSKGKQIYADKCQRCHGPEGKGDGPDADPEHRPDDLTDAGRAARNPDGVMFYKVLNGRKKPKMPAFKGDLSPEDIWTVVTYVKTLRQS